MKEPVKNIPASIQARLKTEAELQRRPFAEIIQYYALILAFRMRLPQRRSLLIIPTFYLTPGRFT